MNMTRDKARELAEDMLAALQSVATKHGVQIKDKGGKFDPNGGSATFKFEAAFLNDQGQAETAERKEYKLFAVNLGLKPEWLDQTFRFNSADYKIVGLRTRRSKNPVLVQRQPDGRTFVFSHDYVKSAMTGTPYAPPLFPRP